jgi:hypothetical protein
MYTSPGRMRSSGNFIRIGSAVAAHDTRDTDRQSTVLSEAL